MAIPTLDYQRPMVARPMREQSKRVHIIVGVLIALAWLALGAITLVVATGIARVICPPAIVPGLLVMLLIIMSLPYAGRAIRGRRIAGLLGYLEQAMRLNLPLPQMLYAAQKSESGRMVQRLEELRSSLQAGAPLSMALCRIPEIPDRTRQLLAAAERTGQLPAMLRRMLDEEEHRQRSDDASDRSFMCAYLGAYPLIAVGIVSMLLVFVMPKFERIFKDFGVSLPEATQWLLRLGRSEVAPVAVAIFITICVMWIGSKLWELIVPRSIVGPWNWPQWLAWWTPIVGSAIRDRGLGDIFCVLADTTRAGYPLPAALAEAGGLRLNIGQAMQMCRWIEGVDAGQPMSEAARRAGLPQLVVGLLSSAQQSGEAQDAFAFLSSYYSGRFSRLSVFLRSAMVPAMTLIFGAIVLFITLSLFSPMITLIGAVSGSGRTL